MYSARDTVNIFLNREASVRNCSCPAIHFLKMRKIMTTTLIEECPSSSTEEICTFLARYGSALLGSGATCIRLEKNMNRIAQAFGKRVEVATMPRHLHISVCDPDGGACSTAISSPSGSGISFDINTRLSALSWEIADARLSLGEANERFNAIICSSSRPSWLLTPAVALANASFCRLFGGDFIAMGVVFVATLVGFYMKSALLRRGVDIRVTVFVCAFISSVLGATDVLFGIGGTPAIALGTSVLYLVPGIPFLNSFSDMLYRHYICSLSRFADAMVLTACLSAGLCAGMALMGVGMF